ncbi:DinB family protein [Pedobacter sp.]|jgi:hypothetical protein|uniref:DinB family protein n=1 Tax=Pedobacter sp. TaxID=1411316 RepID=UPI002C475030|nr:DinB family protein [Pedobacter sp.]HWW40392.1 DinB family protein [Pedobacter sp.]
MNEEQKKSLLIKELGDLLSKGNAHVTFEEAVKDISLDKLMLTPENLPYNIFQLAEHIRIAQWDIVEFCLNPNHVSPQWPEGYWISSDDMVSKQAWDHILHQIKRDRDRFIQFLKTTDTDLFEPLPQGSGQNLFKEALLIADHTAYHIGEIILIRRLLKIWN